MKEIFVGIILVLCAIVLYYCVIFLMQLSTIADLLNNGGFSNPKLPAEIATAIYINIKLVISGIICRIATAMIE